MVSEYDGYNRHVSELVVRTRSTQYPLINPNQRFYRLPAELGNTMYGELWKDKNHVTAYCTIGYISLGTPLR